MEITRRSMEGKEAYHQGYIAGLEMSLHLYTVEEEAGNSNNSFKKSIQDFIKYQLILFYKDC